MERRGQELGLMMNAPRILQRLERDIEKRAWEFKPIDVEMTQTRMEIAASMQQGRSTVEVKEKPPALGQMSDQEFRNYTKQFGF